MEKYREASCWVELIVDLSSGKICVEESCPEFLGGRGENHYRLLQMTSPATTALDPNSPFFLASGPLVGTGFPGASRIHLAAKSPINGGLGSSNAGSAFSQKLRLAGFDQIIVIRRAATPVYLVLEKGKATIKKAEQLWGMTIPQADNYLRRWEGENISTAIIGPAGERSVVSACILFDACRAAGRCGLGSVMGSKYLKAIVVKGEGQLKVADKTKFLQIIKTTLQKIEKSKVLRQIQDYGTIHSAPFRVEPVRNFQQGIIPEEAHRIQHEFFLPYRIDHYGCPNCPIQCGVEYHIVEGRFTGKGSTALHANSITDFGTRLGIYDPQAIIVAHGLCNEYGLDIDNASGVIAWSIEAFQRRILTTEDTDGLSLSWGNVKAVLTLLKQIAYRQGIGELLAKGCQAAAVELGQESREFCINVKGQELEEALRPFKGWALGVIVSERGGSHTRGAPLLDLAGGIPPEISARAGLSPEFLPSMTYEGKAQVVVYYERLHAIMDSLGVCYFVSDWVDPDLPSFPEFAEAISAAIGKEFSHQELLKTGERIHVLGKLFNLANTNFRRTDDYPPYRLMHEPIEDGKILAKEEWDQMLNEYYQLHGWDIATSIPNVDKPHSRL